MRTLLDLFRSFRDRGEKTAIVYRTGVRRFVYSYERLFFLSLKMNALLSRYGVEEEDRVLVWAPNSPWWAVVFWGCVARGAVVAPVDFVSGRERAETAAALTDARMIVRSRYKGEDFGSGPNLFVEDLESLLAHMPPLAETFRDDPSATAEIIYTSGTTGVPKGVVLTHRNLTANLNQVSERIPVVGPEYNFLSLLPLSHMFELMAGFLIPLYGGASIVYLRSLKPSAIRDALREEDLFAAVCVPRLLHFLKTGIERDLEEWGVAALFRLLHRVGGRLPLGLKKLLFFPIRRRFGKNFVLFVSGGASLPTELFRYWSVMGFRVIEGYGLTECSPVLTANSMDRQVEGSVGTPLPGVAIRIEGGEVLARGENVFSGYYRDEGVTREAFTADGWFRTGDLGRFDSDGFLRILGRGKEMIVTSAGMNVFPDEVEKVLNSLPGVRESCVLGVDRGSGEEVHAVLLLEGEARPAEIVREANDHLDSTRRITGFTVWPEPEFPKTTTLKIRKFLVRGCIEGGFEEKRTVSSDRLIALIAEATGASPGSVGENSFLVDDLGLTSIGQLELINRLEREFNLDLEDSSIHRDTTVSDLRVVLTRRERPKCGRKLRFWTNRPSLRLIRRIVDSVFHDPLLGMFATIEASGIENLTGVNPPVMFVANHLSYLDQPAVMASLPPCWRYGTSTAAWEEFFFVNYRTWCGKLWKRFTYEYGTIFFNLFPLSKTRGFRASLAFMGRLADHGINILLFPEGARSPDGRLQPFRPGVGVMARELGVPVIPVRIFGMERILPPGVGWPRRGRARVCFGTALDCSGETASEITERVRRAVAALE